ncbi:hypothetical protein RB653_008225 [Dictyostelium firmibasis]|uniref:Sugar transporter SWEET1 n=1 Tax=Dictyostelium firmibasis TaxID=79012 RepID=A0AAN7UC93_9MYCE
MEEENNEMLMTFVQLSATIITITLFIMPLKTIRIIIDRQNVGTVAGLQFISSTLNCFLWVSYALLTSNTTMLFVNSIGMMFSIYYVVNYWKNITQIRVSRDYLKKVMIACVLAITIISISYYNTTDDLDTRISRLGFLSSVVCVLMFASPLEKMANVIQSRNSEGMIQSVAILSLLCGLSWTLFGLLLNDIYVYLPNILASILSFVQLTLIKMYPPQILI